MLQTINPNSIRPEGWLRDQLRIQADGLMGNLDRLWPDVRDSAWIGGNREGWERVPYWLDGFIPLAFLLKDEDMIGRAKNYVDGILSRQREDGWICPCREEDIPHYDLWALFLIGKVLTLYYEFTGDPKIPAALNKAFADVWRRLSAGTVRLVNWGKYRWFEALIPIAFLYEREKEDWLLRLAETIRAQGADYPSFSDRWVIPLNVWTMETHIVNLGMMLKTEALETMLFGKSENSASNLDGILKRYNGTAIGTYTGDECLAGISNVQGTELCSVNELMYSLEWLYRVTGKTAWADKLERVAFNALPATFSDDMWTHQYLQMVNQIECSRFPNKAIFRTNGGESNLFGLEPNYGCCTANGGQGWPKFAMNVLLKESDTVLVLPMLLPFSAETELNGSTVSVHVETDYPFRHSARITVGGSRENAGKLRVRVPGWAGSVTVNGKDQTGNRFLVLPIGAEEAVYEVTYSDTPHLESRPHGLKCAAWGPLVFALPREAEYTKSEYVRDGVERKFPYCDYELTSSTPWQYGLTDAPMTVSYEEGDAYPFSSVHPRVVLRCEAATIDWGYADGYTTVSAPVPKCRKALSAPEEKVLYPYGCAKLRVTELPLIRK